VTAGAADPGDPADRRIRARSALDALVACYGAGMRNPGQPDLIDALFVEADDGTGWLTAIAELSVSFRATGPVAIRALSEVCRRRRMDPALVTAGLRWGTGMLRRLASGDAGASAISLFRDIYEMVYRRNVAAPIPLFRFGIAIQFGGASPVLKVYFDLHATGAEHRRRTLHRVAGLLGATTGLECWMRACPSIDLDTSRVIGVDFGAGQAVRAKFYWGARHLTWDQLVAASREISGERHTGTLRRLEREVGGGPGAGSSLLVSMCCANGTPSMKLDLCVARLYPNDGEAYDAIERFRSQVIGGDGPAPLAIVTGGLNPRQTRCVQQYLGVELPRDQSPRVTIYYRPIGLDTEHLNPALRPRMCA
jgi:hypothetical protein